jgi:hypothetical protein
MISLVIEERILTGPAAVTVWADRRTVFMELRDRRIVGFPADRFRILKEASDEQLKHVELCHDGLAMRWNELNEEITVPRILEGNFQLP